MTHNVMVYVGRLPWQSGHAWSHIEFHSYSTYTYVRKYLNSGSYRFPKFINSSPTILHKKYKLYRTVRKYYEDRC